MPLYRPPQQPQAFHGNLILRTKLYFMIISCLDLLCFEIKQENLIFHGLCKCLFLSLQLKRKEKEATVENSQHSGQGD